MQRIGRWTGIGRGDASAANWFWALRDVSLAVLPGEAVGVIGPNGAGKSTILKLLAGILRPDGGRVAVSGRTAALIEIGAGFHGDLTGRENVFLNGAILGMSRREIRAKLDSIVAFAGLERFLDMPVKRYSSGMYARLGFSIAAHVDPDVLLVDEVLSVGDALFRLRCLDRMRELVRNGAALVFITHDLDQMQSICRRAVVLEGGAVAFSGSPRQAVEHYLGAMTRSYVARPADVGACGGVGAVELAAFRVGAPNDPRGNWITSGQCAEATLELRLARKMDDLVVELNLRGPCSDGLISFNSGRSGARFAAAAGGVRIGLSLPALPLAGGQYFWSVRAWDRDRGICELDTPYGFPMFIDDGGKATGSLCLVHAWSFASAPKSSDREDLMMASSDEVATSRGVPHEALHLR